METTVVQPPARRRSSAVWFAPVGLVLAAAVVIAVVGVVRSSHLSSRVDRLSTQLAAEQATVGKLQAQQTVANGTSAQDVKTLRASVKKLQARLKLYDTCVPEIMGQINSLQGNVVSTGPLYVSPSQSVSHFCQQILFGSSTPGD